VKRLRHPRATTSWERNMADEVSDIQIVYINQKLVDAAKGTLLRCIQGEPIYFRDAPAGYVGYVAASLLADAIARLDTETATVGRLTRELAAALAPAGGVAGATKLDACEECHGAKGGVPGNENIVDGRTLCDYCHAAAETPEMPVSPCVSYTATVAPVGGSAPAETKRCATCAAPGMPLWVCDNGHRFGLGPALAAEREAHRAEMARQESLHQESLGMFAEENRSLTADLARLRAAAVEYLMRSAADPNTGIAAESRLREEIASSEPSLRESKGENGVTSWEQRYRGLYAIAKKQRDELKAEIAKLKTERDGCKGVIPGTVIACGEGGNYCSPACHRDSLRAENERLTKLVANYQLEVNQYQDMILGDDDQAAVERNRKRDEENAALREALRPFAEAAKAYEGAAYGDDAILDLEVATDGLRVRDVRRAARAMEGK